MDGTLRYVGVVVAAVAVVGSTLLGWEWGDGRLVPTAVGVGAALVAVGVALSADGTGPSGR